MILLFFPPLYLSVSAVHSYYRKIQVFFKCFALKLLVQNTVPCAILTSIVQNSFYIFVLKLYTLVLVLKSECVQY